MARTLNDVIKGLPLDQQQEIKVQAARLIEDEMPVGLAVNHERGDHPLKNEQSFASVWDAIEDIPAEAENMKLRSTLMMTLKNHIASSGMSQLEAVKLFNITQPRFCDLIHGKIHLFSIDTLINMAAAAGIHYTRGEHMRKNIENAEYFNVSDLPEEEQQPFRKWLRGNDIYNADQYDMWKANPHKVWRECGKGWFSLIDDCEKELAGLGVEDKHWRQVKEKFGELRLYITTEYLADEIAQRVRNVTSKYVLKSSTTCELCGSEQGFLMSDSSRKITICQVCNSKLFNGVFHPTSTHKVPNR